MRSICGRTTAILLLLTLTLTLTACAGSRRPDLGPAVLAQLSLADIPDAIAITPDGGKAYVAARGKVYVIRPLNGALLATIPLPPAPRAMALSPDGKRLFVGDFADLQLTIVDTDKDSVVQRVPIGRDGIPWESSSSVVTVSPNGRTVFVGTPGTSQLWAIDTADPAVQRSTTLTMRPGAVAGGSPDAVYVAGCPHGCLRGEFGTYDPVSLQRRAAVDLPSPAGRTLIAPQRTHAYVLERPANRVAVVDLSKPRIVATIPTGNLPGDIALAPDGAVLYATSFGDRRLLVIDTATRAVVGITPIAAGPRGVAASPDGRFVVVTAGLDQLIVFDAGALRQEPNGQARRQPGE